jgi:acetyl/propionyl-CoA carboxylase alpha subunit
VSIYYDPMISKLAAWGRTRAEAVERMRRALLEYSVGGIRTTLPFFREVMRDPEFLEGRLDTGFITRFNERRRTKAVTIDEGDDDAAGDRTLTRDLAAIAAALDYTATRTAPDARQPSSQTTPSRWRLAGRAAQLNVR